MIFKTLSAQQFLFKYLKEILLNFRVTIISIIDSINGLKSILAAQWELQTWMDLQSHSDFVTMTYLRTECS